MLFIVLLGSLLLSSRLPAVEPYSILVSTVYSGENELSEFTPQGSLIRRITFNYNGGQYPGAEALRDITVDQTGVINAFNGTFSPLLTRYVPASNTYTNASFPGWNTINSLNYGGIGSYQNFIYVTDMTTAGQGAPAGIVRFDTTANTAARFADGIDFIDLNIGRDGKLYGLYPGGSPGGTDINVYDPVTMSLLNHISVPPDSLRRLAVDKSGRIYLCGLGRNVYRLSPTGATELAVDCGYNYLNDIDVDDGGHIVIAHPNGGQVIVSDTSLSQFVPFQAVEGISMFMFVAFSAPLPPAPPLQLVSVVSRKTHGSAGVFDIDLPLSGPPGVECRNKVNDYSQHQLVFRFTNPLSNVVHATVSSGNGQWYSSWIGADAHEYYVHLLGVSNGQVITVTLTDVTDTAGNYATSFAARMAVLIGDSTASGATNSADVSYTKSQVGNVETNSNFRADLNADGAIDSADIGLAKSSSGTALP